MILLYHGNKKTQGVIQMFNIDNTLLAQIIGFIGTIIIVIGMQQKKYGRIVFCKISNEFIAAIHYFLLGG